MGRSFPFRGDSLVSGNEGWARFPGATPKGEEEGPKASSVEGEGGRGTVKRGETTPSLPHLSCLSKEDSGQKWAAHGVRPRRGTRV